MSLVPSMPVFPDALMSDTADLSAEEFGAYCLILFATWRNNGTPFPDDDERLARIARVSKGRWCGKLRDAIIKFFDLSNGVWRQKRLEKEWNYIVARKAERSLTGRDGANKRWTGTPRNEGTRNRRIREASARARGRHTEEEWGLMLRVFGEQCLVCGRADGITKDHVVSLFDGGDDSIENLQPICFDCNSKKGSLSEDYRDPNLLKQLISSMAKPCSSHQQTDSKPIASQPLTLTHKEESPPIGGRQSGRQIATQMSEIWNQECGPVGLRRVLHPNKPSKQRVSACNARFRDDLESDMAQWIALLRRVTTSSFLIGNTPVGFRATLDWVLKPSNTIKILEGNYDDRDLPASKSNGHSMFDTGPTEPPPTIEGFEFPTGRPH